MIDFAHIYKCLNKKEKRKLFEMNMEIYSIGATNGTEQAIQEVLARMEIFQNKMAKKYDTTKTKNKKGK